MAVEVTKTNYTRNSISFARCCKVIVLAWFTVVSINVSADQVLRFGTGGSDGTYFPIGSLIADSINDQCVDGVHQDQLIVLPQRSNGSVSNLTDLSENMLEMALAQADVISSAYQGEGEFQKTSYSEKIRTVGSLFLESVHLVVLADSDIQGIADLAGKRVSVDELGSGTQRDVEPLLEAHGISSSDIQAVYLKPVDSIDRMRRGLLDAFFVIAGYPVTSVKHLVEDGIGRVVSVDSEETDSLKDEYRFFTSHSIPENVYSNDNGIVTLGVSAQMIVHADVAEEAVYRITKTLWSECMRSILMAGHPRGEDITAQTALQGIAIPLHPGAARYYREQGYDLESLQQ